MCAHSVWGTASAWIPLSSHLGACTFSKMLCTSSIIWFSYHSLQAQCTLRAGKATTVAPHCGLGASLPIRIFQAEPWASFLVAKLWGWSKESQTPGTPEPAHSLNSPSCPPAGRCWEAYLGRVWERREEGTPWTEWWWRRGREQVGTCPPSSAPTAKHNSELQSIPHWMTTTSRYKGQ